MRMSCLSKSGLIVLLGHFALSGFRYVEAHAVSAESEFKPVCYRSRDVRRTLERYLEKHCSVIVESDLQTLPIGWISFCVRQTPSCYPKILAA